MNKEEHIVELKNNLMELTKNGFRCFMLSETQSPFGYIITPQDNVMCVKRGYYGGWEFILKYVPSRSTGTGCMCFGDEPQNAVTLEIVLEAEKEGLIFASSVKAKLYKNSDEFFRQLYNKDKLVEIKL